MPTPTKIKGTLAQISPFAEDVFKLDFEVDKKYTRFKPGQFLHLTLDDFDPTQAYWPESRVFSICSRPRSTSLSIVYSVKGQYTNRMRRELKKGTQYWLKLPYGDFIIEQLVPDGCAVVLVAGGTGISPYVAYLEEGLDQGFERSVYLAYAVRSPDRLGFHDLIAKASRSTAVQTRVWSESSSPTSDLVTDQGRLSLATVLEDVADMPEPHFLLSGPPPMLEAFGNMLRSEFGVEPNRVHIDEWE